MNPVVITFDQAGQGSCLYNELIDLQTIGHLEVTRATEIGFNPLAQQWEVIDKEEKILFSHSSRSVCLAWEQQQFNR